MCPLTYLSSPLIENFLPRLNQLLSGKFFIVDLVFGVEFRRGYSSPRKLSKKLLLISIGFNISERRLVEHKGICCFIFS